MKIIYFFSIVIISWNCTHKAVESQASHFVLSDTMASKCSFFKTKIDSVKDEIKLFGKITAANNHLANVYPIVGGNVIKINVELGDFVPQGKVLATIRSSEVAGFEQQKLNAHADVALAEKNFQIAKELFAGKLNSEKDIISAQKDLEKAQAELKRINEIYDIFRFREGSIYDITAPISGFVILKNINQNEQLRSDKADIIFSIAQIDEVWVLANVNESDISRIVVGCEAEVNTISYPNITFTGKVDRIFNAIDPTTKAMTILIKIPNKNLLLKPEMNATVTLHYKENRKLVMVPSSAIIFDKNKNWMVVYQSKDSIDIRQIEVFRLFRDTSYITSGVSEGETVISKNGLMIFDALTD